MSEAESIQQGAVLYDQRPDGHRLDPASERGLCHVLDVYEHVDNGDRLYHVSDGTHTYYAYLHEDTLTDCFEPAGWQWPSGRKPLYHLTRVCGVEDAADLMTDGGVDVERFVEHPAPDRFFMQIEPAEVEMVVHDHDDVTFKSQLVPGGSFGVELTASYSYAGRDCKQHLSLDRDAAESLHERLGEVLEADSRE